MHGADLDDDVDRGLVACWSALLPLREDAIRTVRRRGLHAEDAEDHVHDAMLRLAERRLVDLEPVRLRALLVRVACGIAIDRHRRRARQWRLLPRLVDVAACTSPEEIAADRGEASWLAGGLPALGRMERAALLHAVEGRRLEEIAALLSVDYKAAENALGRARRKLRQRAAAVTVAVGALLRRLRGDRTHGGQAVAISASAVAVALLMLGPGAAPGRAATSPRPPQPRVAAPGQLLAVATARIQAARPIGAAAVHVAAGVAAHARTAVSATGTPPPSAPPLQMPWQGSPGARLQMGHVVIQLDPGTPGGWLLSCTHGITVDSSTPCR